MHAESPVFCGANADPVTIGGGSVTSITVCLCNALLGLSAGALAYNLWCYSSAGRALLEELHHWGGAEVQVLRFRVELSASQSPTN